MTTTTHPAIARAAEARRARRKRARWCIAVSCLLHATALATLPFVVVAESNVAESYASHDDTPTFQLDLRTTSLLDAQDDAAEIEGSPESDLAPIDMPQALEQLEVAQANPVVEPEVVPLEVPLPEIVQPDAEVPEPEVAQIVEPVPVPEPTPIPEPVDVPPPVAESPAPNLPLPVTAPAPDPAPAAPAPPASSPPVATNPQGSGSSTPSTTPPTGAPATEGKAGASTTPATRGTTAGGLGGSAADDGKALRARRTYKPTYPESSRRRGEEGTVTCRLTIDRDGKVVQVEMVTSSGFKALDDAAMKTLERWLFEPLERLTDRDRVHAIQRLTFELKGKR